MSLQDLIKPFPWSQYSQKIREKIKRPFSFGRFTKEEARERKMRLARGNEGSVEDGNLLTIYLLIDEADGMVVDARFQAYGHAVLLAALEAFCILIVGKGVSQVQRIGADLIDKQLRDDPLTPACPQESAGHLNLILSALDSALEGCQDIVQKEQYSTPLPEESEYSEGVPGWKGFSKQQKKEILEKILDEEIRPYIELDAGGVKLLDIVGDEVKISYQGSCTSCFSAIGSTLASIQQMVQVKIHPDLTVVPDMDNLSFH